MKFFALFAILATATQAARLSEDTELETLSGADVATFIQTLDRMNTRIKQRDQTSSQA